MATTARERALERKAVYAAVKAQKEAEEAERAEARAWSVGAKDSSRQKEAEDKEAQKRQKAAEKAALLEAEEAELGSIKRVGKPAKKKGNDDFKFLQQALANQPKTRAQKEQEERQRLEAERRKKEDEARTAREEREQAQEQERKRLLAKGIVVDHAEQLMVPLNNRREADDFEHVTGMDAAIDMLSIDNGTSSKSGYLTQKKLDGMFRAYREKMLPQVKEEYPGLRLTQYDEKIGKMWKKAPENPLNSQ